MIATALEQCQTWSTHLQTKRNERNTRAYLLGNALLPLAQQFRSAGQASSSPPTSTKASTSTETKQAAGTERKEIQHDAEKKNHSDQLGLSHSLRECTQTLQNLVKALVSEQEGQAAAAENYPQQAVLSALRAIQTAMAEQEREVQAIGPLIKNWRYLLNPKSRGKEGKTSSSQEDFSVQALEQHHKQTRKQARSLKKELRAAMDALDDAKEDRDKEAEAEAKQEMRKVRKKMATQHTQAHAYRDRAVQHLVKHAPEILVPNYWSQVKREEVPPSWAAVLIHHFDVDGLEQTGLSFDMYTDKKMITPSGANHPVYVATRNGQRVALKRYAVDDRDKRKMLREAKLLHRLGRDPHVCGIHHTFWDTQHNYLYIEMPYYSGGKLTDFKQNTGAHPTQEQLKVLFRQILMGLAFLHDQKVIHCDIKPDNIFLVEAHNRGPFLLQAKIGDFDVSKDKSERTMSFKNIQTMTSFGFTGHYLAPELLETSPKEASAASDVYAAGLMFFDLWVQPQPPRPVPTKTNQPPVLNEKVCKSRQVAELLQGWLHRDPRQRLTAKQLLAQPFFMEGELRIKEKMEEEVKKARGPPREGCSLFCSNLCLEAEQLYLSDGLDCPAGNAAHFMCRECLSLYVIEETKKKSDIMIRQGLPFCPKKKDGCDCEEPYDLRLLAPLVTPEAYELQLRALQEVHERKLASEHEESKKQAIQKALEEYKRRAEVDVQVLKCRKHIEDKILGRMRCPREQCGLPFNADLMDFDECLALTCQGCNYEFCGWCLKVIMSFVVGNYEFCGW